MLTFFKPQKAQKVVTKSMQYYISKKYNSILLGTFTKDFKAYFFFKWHPLKGISSLLEYNIDVICYD